jgi:hypothetical protein
MDERYHNRIGAAASAVVRSAKADHVAETLAPHFEAAWDAGCVSHNSIARYLNDAGIPATRGGVWTQMQVKRVLDRLAKE